MTSRYKTFSPSIDLVVQVKDMQTKLDEAESLAVQGGRKVTSRLEQKIKVHRIFLNLWHLKQDWVYRRRD